MKGSVGMNDEDRKLLEDFVKEFRYDYTSLAQAIENLLKENKELSEENAILKRANNISEDVKIEDITKFINKSIEDFNKEYIPVAKIKEKIEELDRIIQDSKTGRHRHTLIEASIVKSELQELLEGK